MKSRYDKEKERYEKYKESISLLKTGDDISNLKFLLNLYGGSYKTMASLMTYIAAESLVKEKREIYGKSKEAYQKVLDNFNRLIEELNIDTSLGVALLNSHMVWDGYFSYNKENKYNDKDILNLPGLHGLDVFNGGGTCLNYSHFLEDSLNNCGITSAAVACATPFKTELQYVARTDKEEKKLYFGTNPISLITYPISKGVSHAITIINDGDYFYSFDPTNRWLFSIDNKLNANIVGGKGAIKLHPCISLLTFGNLDSHKIYDSFFDDKENMCFSLDEFKDINRMVLALMKSNSNLLEDFYNCNHENYELVHDEMLKHGNGRKIK